MTAPDTGVDLLLRRATDDLRPDVDQLVAGGITRGRTRRRRARIGTAVAAVAVFGVFGAAAAVVPHLGSDASQSGEIGVGVAGSPLASEKPAPRPVTTVRAALGMKASDIPNAVAELLDRTDVSGPLAGPPNDPHDAKEQRVVHFHISGRFTSVYIDPSEPTEAVDPVEGVVWDTWESDPGMPIQARGVSVWRDGYAIQVTSYNSADRYDESSVLSAAPLLSVDQMLTVAKSRVWFR